jgi:hypothetical protein
MHVIPVELTIGAAVLGAASVVYSILRLIALLRESVIVRLPAREEQDVRFANPGPVLLCIEVPHFSSVFAGVDFAMRDDFGHEVPSTPIVFRTKVSGFSSVRLSVRTFDIARAGRYQLHANGLERGSDLSKAALVFMRPFAGAMVLWILGITFGGIALIGGTVLTALNFAGVL